MWLKNFDLTKWVIFLKSKSVIVNLIRWCLLVSTTMWAMRRMICLKEMMRHHQSRTHCLQSTKIQQSPTRTTTMSFDVQQQKHHQSVAAEVEQDNGMTTIPPPKPKIDEKLEARKRKKKQKKKKKKSKKGGDVDDEEESESEEIQKLPPVSFFSLYRYCNSIYLTTVHLSIVQISTRHFCHQPNSFAVLFWKNTKNISWKNKYLYF